MRLNISQRKLQLVELHCDSRLSHQPTASHDNKAGCSTDDLSILVVLSQLGNIWGNKLPVVKQSVIVQFCTVLSPIYLLHMYDFKK